MLSTTIERSIYGRGIPENINKPGEMVPISVAELSALLQHAAGGGSVSKTHADRFASAGKARAPEVRRLLREQQTLTEVERVLLTNLKPLSVHEAHELIPSLRDHIDDTDLQELLKNIMKESNHASRPVVGTTRLPGVNLPDLLNTLYYTARQG